MLLLINVLNVWFQYELLISVITYEKFFVKNSILSYKN